MSVVINIQIPENVVSELLSNGQSVAFSVQSNSPQILSTVWGTIRPSTSSTVQWSEQYGIYASNGQLSDGAQINTIAQLSSAAPGVVYPYLASGGFGGPTGPGPNDGITILNQNQQPNLIFGTLQTAVINGQVQQATPVLAGNVFTQQQVTFPDSTNVTFFITQQFRAGQVISHIPMPSITVNTKQNPTAHLSFNGMQWSQN